MPGLPIAVISDRPLSAGESQHVRFPDRDPGARLAKLNLDSLSPYERTVYLDADTRVRGSLEVGFLALDAGWEIVITPSKRQGGDALGNCPEADRQATFKALGTEDVLALQAGVMWFARTEGIARLFAAWRAEWGKHGGMDQAALLRALYANPVRLWLTGHAWNGGEVVEHRFGAARRAA